MREEWRERLIAHGQQHLLAELERLDPPSRSQLLQELSRIDLAELARLHGMRVHKDALPERERIAPLPIPRIEEAEHHRFVQRGEEAFRAGEVAFLLVAGGQGTRLGFDDPKGTFPIGPVTGRSLFQIIVEKILALRQRCGGRALPLLIMTSPATDAPTRRYFEKHENFGLPADDIWYFCQGTMPALDLVTGRLLFEAPGRLSLSPNGHGGTITGLAEAGLFDRLRERGVRTLSYFQVDNPLVKLADFLFIGRHVAQQAQVSSKVLPKTGPKEKVGNFVLVDGRCSMIEYSDLPDEWSQETDADGRLKFWAGNPAIHLFDVEFLNEITSEADRMPWHLARKRVPYVDDAGRVVTPTTENGLKFERFIFDVLPQAERWTVLPTARADEFAPVKNRDADLVDTPASARLMMCAQAASWLRQAGVDVAPGVKVEISPLFAQDADELAAKVKGLARIDKDTYLG